MSINRVPAGVPTGGQFAEGRRTEQPAAVLPSSGDPRAPRTPDDVQVRDNGTAFVYDAYGEVLALEHTELRRIGPDGDDKLDILHDRFADFDSGTGAQALARANAIIAAQPPEPRTPKEAALALASGRLPDRVRTEAAALVADPKAALTRRDSYTTDEAALMLTTCGFAKARLAAAAGEAEYDRAVASLVKSGRLEPHKVSRLASLAEQAAWAREHARAYHRPSRFDAAALAAETGRDPGDPRIAEARRAADAAKDAERLQFRLQDRFEDSGDDRDDTIDDEALCLTIAQETGDELAGPSLPYEYTWAEAEDRLGAETMTRGENYRAAIARAFRPER